MYDIEAKLGFHTDRLEKLYSAAKDKKFTDVQFTVHAGGICISKMYFNLVNFEKISFNI